ncbi:MAG TPA: HEPN domain-containing protein [Gemmataceae bacterium]|nr:HEPN domain-containing protein [Gemmataceae bacterium]
MNGRDFLSVAVRLAAEATEADWRSAISPAYYAAFHIARRLLADLNFTVPRADRAHQYLIFRLSNCGEPVVEQAGRDLETLRRLRNRADYDDALPCTQPQAVAAVRRAEDVIRQLDNARSDPPRTRIRDAMIAYERDVLNDVTWHP